MKNKIKTISIIIILVYNNSIHTRYLLALVCFFTLIL